MAWGKDGGAGEKGSVLTRGDYILTSSGRKQSISAKKDTFDWFKEKKGKKKKERDRFEERECLYTNRTETTTEEKSSHSLKEIPKRGGESRRSLESHRLPCAKGERG